MEYYAIDITKPRIQKAMENLGIAEEELVLKTQDDFGAKESNEEIRKLRFNYYERKQSELVRQIKSFVKEDILRFREKALRSERKDKPSTEVLITSLGDALEESLMKTKTNFRKIVDKTFYDVKGAFTEKNAIDEKLRAGEKNRKKAKSALSKNRSKNVELKEKQLENLKLIRESEKEKLRSYYRNTCSASPKRFKSTKGLYEESRSRSRSGSVQDIDIDEKIFQYEEKMNRSKLLYELTIQRKKNAVSKLLERTKRPKILEQQNSLVEKISKLVVKNKTAEDRRYSHMKLMAETREKNKEKQDERRQRAQTKLKEREVQEKNRGKEIEKRMKISNSLLQKKHKNWAKELELRNEMQRLKDEEALNNAERKKRIM